MNTPKKEDMLNERGRLYTEIGFIVANFLRPLAQILGATGRIAYLDMELDKVMPKVAPEPEEKN